MAGKTRMARAALLAAALLAGCGDGDIDGESRMGHDADGEPQVPQVETVPRPEQTIAAGRLSPVNDSGVTGSVNVRGIGDATELALNVTGVTQGTEQIDAAVVRGTCEAPGADVAPVGPLIAGAGDIFALTDTLALPPATVLDGGHALVIRAIEAGPAAPSLACSPLPRWEPELPTA